MATTASFDAIIFDCFGVLYTDTKLSLLDVVPQARRQELQDIFTRNNYGYMDRHEYLEAVASVADLEVAEIEDYMAGEHRLNTDMTGFIRTKLRGNGIKVALLSNIGRDWIDDFFSKHDLHVLFDEVVLSGDEGIAKPHPAAFELVADRLGVAPERCLMVDDRAENCEGAQIAGMQTIQFIDTPQTIFALEQLLT